jgi:hypothetical protein
MMLCIITRLSQSFLCCRDAALEMVSMKKYSGMTGTSKGQPFRVVVAADVVLLADLHAHLSTDGVHEVYLQLKRFFACF